MDNVDEFTVHLPSNTRFMEENCGSKFTVKLALPANLSGEWECGLKEIHYPRTWDNVTDSVGKMLMIVLDPMIRGLRKIKLGLPAKRYESPAALTTAMQKTLRAAIPQNPSKQAEIRVVYNEESGKAEINLPHGISLSLTPPLAHILGFDNTPEQNMYENHNGPKPTLPMSITLVDALYVYSDVVQSSLVGDVMVPLLRIVPVMGKLGEMCHKEYIKPVYFPVAKLNFSTIDIYITDSVGRQIEFEHGKTTIMLHFRRKKDLKPRV